MRKSPPSWRIFLACPLLLGLLTVSPLEAQTNRKPGQKTAPAKRAPGQTAGDRAMTPERQAAALKFAERHHPELHQLLQNLKKSSRPEYQKAVRQLDNDSERLARIKERLPARYELALEQWQLDSRLRLMVARMTMSADDPERQAELEELLKKRLDVRLELLKLDRERLTARLSKLDDQLQEIESDREAALEKDLLRIQRSLGLNRRNPKRPPASKTPPRTPPKKSNR